MPFAQIYAAFVCLDVSGRARVTADWYERPELWNEGDRELLITAGACAHRALRYHSIGAIRLTVQNEDTVPIPFGPICCRMEQGKSPELTIPPQIKVL